MVRLSSLLASDLSFSMSIGEKLSRDVGEAKSWGGSAFGLSQPHGSTVSHFCYFNYKVFNDMLSWFAASLPHPGC